MKTLTDTGTAASTARPPQRALWEALDNTQDPDNVRRIVRDVVQRISPEHDLAEVENAAIFVLDLFDGRIEGYQALRTPYHNRTHTLEVLLCAARLLHGWQLSGGTASPALIDAVLIGALLHDSGYVLADDETGGTGAQFTSRHVERGIAMAGRHFKHLPADVLDMAGVAILATDHKLDPRTIEYATPDHRHAAFILATADLAGQMASRQYLERLLLLYTEFREAGITAFSDALDLLEKTLAFYTSAQERLFVHLDGYVARLSGHFQATQGSDANHYLHSIDQNISYLKHILGQDRDEWLDHLKRGGIVQQMKQIN